jgi:hypothetical protein
MMRLCEHAHVMARILRETWAAFAVIPLYTKSGVVPFLRLRNTQEYIAVKIPVGGEP